MWPEPSWDQLFCEKPRSQGWLAADPSPPMVTKMRADAQGEEWAAYRWKSNLQSKKNMCQHKASAAEEPFSKTYLRAIHICWKYSQVINLLLRLPSSAGCPHNHASPLPLGSPTEEPSVTCTLIIYEHNHQSCATNYCCKTISPNLLS